MPDGTNGRRASYSDTPSSGPQQAVAALLEVALQVGRQARRTSHSHGVESTTVVRVETLATPRTVAMSSSSSTGVATRTLRM